MLVAALMITAVPMGVSAVTKDATKTVPNKKSLMKLVDEFSTPVAVTETYMMKSGTTKNFNFSNASARASMIRFKAEKKKEINKYSKRMFGVKTKKVTIYPGEWGNSEIVMEIDSIKKTSKKNYYIKGIVYMTTYGDNKRHLCGTFKLYVLRKTSAKYKYVATKLSLTTYKAAKTSSQKIDLFPNGKKYKKVKGIMTYQLISVSGVDGASKINSALRKDYNDFKSRGSKMYTIVAEDNNDPKRRKDTYYFTGVSKVKYNMNNILSIRITTKGYLGAKKYSDEYGYNFNAKTGKEIEIKNVCSGSTKTIKNKMIAAIKKTKSLKKYQKKAIKYVKKTKLSKMEFYMKNDKVIVCFEPKLLGKKQTKFKKFYIQSIYF